eukprot:1553421-Pleurochrysis_carterae.AAC.4
MDRAAWLSPGVNGPARDACLHSASSTPLRRTIRFFSQPLLYYNTDCDTHTQSLPSLSRAVPVRLADAVPAAAAAARGKVDATLPGPQGARARPARQLEAPARCMPRG